MVTATASRGGTSVTFDLAVPSANGITVARDVGKPGQSEQAVGREDPRYEDNFSAQDNFTVFGVLDGPSAYDDAQTLAESLIKPRATTGTPLQLDLSNLPSGQTHDVAPINEQSCVLEYNPGIRNLVAVQLSLVGVSGTTGGSQTAQTHGSPDSGSGVKLETSGGGTPITLSDDLRITRSCGRPPTKKKAGLIAQTDALPKYYDLNQPAFDQFDIRGELNGANAESDAKSLEESLVRARLGNDALNLHFLSNLFSLDKYTVVPVGTQAVRTTFAVGEESRVSVETLKLRVVDQD